MGAPVNGHGVGTPGGGTMSYNLYLNAERMVRAYVGDLEEKMVQLRADLERQQREDARRPRKDRDRVDRPTGADPR